MKKLLLAFTLSSAIILLFFCGDTVSKTKKYHILKWGNTDIAAFLALSDVNTAAFNFNKSWGKYNLHVAGFDTKGNLLGSFPLVKIKGFDNKLGNDYVLGLFILDADKIKQYSQNGSKSLYFLPISVPGSTSSSTVSYVGYEIYDEAPPYKANGVIIKTPVAPPIKPVPPYQKSL